MEPESKTTGISKEETALDNKLTSAYGSAKGTESTELLPKTPEHVYMCGIKQDWWAVSFLFLIRFGDYIELFLPGVITQQVACDLGISRYEEGILCISLYVAQLVSIIISHFLSERYGRKPVLLVSLYSSIVVTILCALVPNYYMLLFSRISVGLSIGLCDTPVAVYCSEVMIDKKFIDIGSFAQALGQGLGAGWVGLLGYMALQTINWRVFIVIAAIPWFVPALLILHCCLPETKNNTTSFSLSNALSFDNNKIRNLTIKMALIGFITHFHGEGIIMLLPNIMRENKAKSTVAKRSECYMVQGNDFLVLGAVSGCGNILGKLAGFALTRGRFSYCKYMSLLTLLTLLCYTATFFYTDHVIVYGLALAVIKLCFGVDRMIRYVVQYDKENFGDLIAVSTGWISPVTQVGLIIGNALPEFTTTFVTLVACIGLCVAKEIAVCSITELGALHK